MAKSTKIRKPAAVTTTEDGKYQVYAPTAQRDAYKKGDVVFFPKVRNWLNKGELIEAYGKVINAGLFDNEVPYIEVSFDDTKKMNKTDLGKDIRRFLLEVK
jgi:hypothetical protein